MSEVLSEYARSTGPKGRYKKPGDFHFTSPIRGVHRACVRKGYDMLGLSSTRARRLRAKPKHSSYNVKAMRAHRRNVLCFCLAIGCFLCKRLGTKNVFGDKLLEPATSGLCRTGKSDLCGIAAQVRAVPTSRLSRLSRRALRAQSEESHRETKCCIVSLMRRYC